MPPIQLAINVDAQKDKLAGYVNAKANVAAYVAALQNTNLGGVSFAVLPPDLKLPGDPTKLLAVVKGNLGVAKQHGQGWSNNIQPVLTAVPQSIINYSSEFQSVLSFMLPLLNDLFANPNDAAKRAEVTDLFNGLLRTVGQQQTGLAGELVLLKQFNTDITSDHGNFASGNSQFAAIQQIESANIMILGQAITGLNSTIAALNKAITVEGIALGVSAGLVAGGAIGFANAETGVGLVVGATCLVVGLVGVGVSAGFLIVDIEKRQKAEQKKAFDQMEVDELTIQVQALNTTESALSKLVLQSEEAMQSVQVILDTWATLQGKLAAVITDLQDSEKEIGDIMSLVDLNTASDQWGQLQTFAGQMQDFEQVVFAQPAVTLPLTTPMKVHVKADPTQAVVTRRIAPRGRRASRARQLAAGGEGGQP